MLAATSMPAGFADAAGQRRAEERAETLYFEAESAWDVGDVGGALRVFASLAEEFPATRYPDFMWRVAGRVRAGEIHLRLGEPDAAAAQFVQALEVEPPSCWSSRARLGLGITLIWQREWQAATNLLQTVVSSAESDSRDADPSAAALAGRLLSLSHRVWVRPATGQAPWQRAGRVAAAGSLDNPVGVAADDLGSLLITDEGLDAVLLIDSSGNSSRSLQQDVRRPWWSPSGMAYVGAKATVAAPQRGEHYQFVRPDGSRQREVRDVRAGANDTLGGWVLLDGDSDEVMLFTAAGEYVQSLDLGADGEPVDVGRGPRGELYVIERRSRSVRLFDPDGTMQGGFAFDGWRQPFAVAVDAVGHVYVLDRESKRIDVFGATGLRLWSLGPTLPGGIALQDPRDIAVDAAGRVFIADRKLSAVIVVE